MIGIKCLLSPGAWFRVIMTEPDQNDLPIRQSDQPCMIVLFFASSPAPDWILTHLGLSLSLNSVMPLLNVVKEKPRAADTLGMAIRPVNA